MIFSLLCKLGLQQLFFYSYVPAGSAAHFVREGDWSHSTSCAGDTSAVASRLSRPTITAPSITVGAVEWMQAGVDGAAKNGAPALSKTVDDPPSPKFIFR